MERAPVRLKYSDVPESVDLMVPTVEAFGAMKLAAYVDRAASRDLFDLKQLVELGRLGDESLELTRRLLGRTLSKQEFQSHPSDNQWELELAHQVSEPGTPKAALDIVRRALASHLGW